MKFIFSALALVLSLGALPGAAVAGPTKIAQLPLLNMDDTGSVKPNLMLLYDNSGSMASAYTPDYIADGTTCRSRATLAGGYRSCTPGQPPFNSPDFNRQYYDPAVLYVPPVDANGASYPSMVSDATLNGNWTKVPTDGFGVNKTDLRNAGATTTDLLAGFPDTQWCDNALAATNCKSNKANYDYPDNTFFNPFPTLGGPYYYSIRVAEWCSDKNLTACTTTPVDAAAPAGFPFPAKIRWCDSTALTNCQAKFSDTTFKYPRFSSPNGGAVPYATIKIEASSATGPIPINSVSVLENGTTSVVITNGVVTASGGANTTANQAKLAELLAGSIVAKMGLTNQYTACVYKPAGTTSPAVPTCASLGITLPSANTTVAVVPIVCPKNVTDKTTCSIVTDTSRNGWAVTADTPLVVSIPEKAAIATLTVSGAAATVTTGKNPVAATQVAGITFNNVSIMGAKTFGSSATSPTVAAAIAAAISGTKLSAVVGGGTGACSTSTSVVCISTTASYAAGQVLLVGTITSPGTLKIGPANTKAGNAEVSDQVKWSATPMGGGSDVFVRTDIVSGRTYPKGTARTDCAGTTCTYNEEMTNFANWYAYYKTRNQMMKTSVGLAFQSINSNFNVGLVSLSGAAGGTSAAMTRPTPFELSARSNWYKLLYQMDGSSTTPLRSALNNVGRMYANQGVYATAAGSEVVQYACQQNYTFMTTDGYWNGGVPTGVLNNDNVESVERYCLASTGCVDKRDSTAGSLADVALYWYNGGSNTKEAGTIYSLRSSLEAKDKGIVPGKDGENTRLHMNTYTLGLGVDGVMSYEDNYDVQPEVGGDFYNLTHNVTTGCPWTTDGAYAWPDPAADDNTASVAYQTRVDDLWHAAINGHGKYFRASNPTQVVTGLRSALSNIKAHAGAAAAAATSAPNLTQTDSDIFSTTFTTVVWSGELTKKQVSPITGEVLPTVLWNTSNSLGLRVGASSDTRTIYMLDTDKKSFKNFSYDVMSSTEKGWFDNKCTLLSQCTSLSVTDKATVNNGAAIVNWLRGQQQYANDLVLRAYGKTKEIPAGATAPLPIILGDISSSKPAYVRDPRKYYTFDNYPTFKSEKAGRNPAVYVGSNDGMLHAFDAKTGAELWAYVPRISMKKLYLQASTTYGTSHQYSVDGSPEVGDVEIGGKWKTVIVSGMAAGGRGYFALDVTDPAAPAPLWETCADKAICSGDNNEPQIGLTFGNPQIGQWLNDKGVNQWVVFVTSGYNNIDGTDGVSGGDGTGWLMILDIATGKVLKKISTAAVSGSGGNTTTPSGLARIAAITSDPNYSALVTYVYGGDILGQMWRFDLTKGGVMSVTQMGNSGTSQPITARPDVTSCAVNHLDKDGNVTSITNQMMVAFGTGRMLDQSDLSITDTQSLYVFKDSPSSISVRGTGMLQQTLTKVVSDGKATTYTAKGTVPNLVTDNGWYVDFDTNKGERVNLDPQIVHGAINLITNIPDTSTSCKVGGSSVAYGFDVCQGLGALNGLAGVQVPGSAATVGYIIVSTSTGELKLEGKLADGSDITMNAANVGSAVSRRGGWRRIRN